jgi:hypothetical protein
MSYPLSSDGKRMAAEASSYTIPIPITNIDTSSASLLASLPGVFGFWEADQYIYPTAGPVAIWQSEAAAAHAAVQATGANQPTFNANGGSNNRPWVQFDGVNDFLASSGIGGTIDPVDSEIYLVAKFTAAGVLGTICDGRNTNARRIFRNNGAQFAATLGGATTVITAVQTDWHMLRLKTNAATGLFQVDKTIATVAGGATAPTGITLGDNALAVNDPGAVGISLVVTAYPALSKANRDALLTYIEAKYTIDCI